jgi:hypothetical protein
MARKPGFTSAKDNNASLRGAHATTRFTASFEYVGERIENSPLLAELLVPASRRKTVKGA